MSDQLSGMVEEIDRLGEGLTAWEIGFIADLIDKNVQRYTEKQAGIIRRIYDQRVSETHGGGRDE